MVMQTLSSSGHAVRTSRVIKATVPEHQEVRHTRDSLTGQSPIYATGESAAVRPL